jgi:hypothetical protein
MVPGLRPMLQSRLLLLLLLLLQQQQQQQGLQAAYQ